MRIYDKNTGLQLMSAQIPYGSKLYFGNGSELKPGDVVLRMGPLQQRNYFGVCG